MTEDWQIIFVVMRHENHRGGGRQWQGFNDLRWNSYQEGIRLGEALRCRKARPTIHHDCVETERPGQLHQQHRHMASPDDDERSWRCMDLHKNPRGCM